MIKRLLPQSLFGQLVLILLTGLVLAQILSAMIMLTDRGNVVNQAIRENMIVRTTGITRLLNSIPSQNRDRLIPLLTSPELRISLSSQAYTIEKMETNSNVAAQWVKQQLEDNLPPNTMVKVSLDGNMMQSFQPNHFSSHHERHMRQMMGSIIHQAHAMARYFHIQIQLGDGTWLLFERGIPKTSFYWPKQLFIVLAILLVSVLFLALIAVRLVTNPLKQLKHAAEGLGKNIQQSPMNETGPSEIAETARVFNKMQQRLQNYIEDKTNILSAVSHDLKTPLTRMKLRTELMDDNELKEKTLNDLNDMETMVCATLDFMRGIETKEVNQSIDLMALIESIQDDIEIVGKKVVLQGEIKQPYEGKPLSLKRCINNLLENAIRYGGEAKISLTDTIDNITILICDKGPGIPESEIEKVFEPFYRLDTSRSQNSGGTGLGLGIARNIARAHGGELSLFNNKEEGLCAQLTLPR